ncbi:hypothetical protein Tco_0874671 [Tanacetum coccineum]|uniref:Uncharacterized protein n=1 Tax=Tanacetum coccineum TaxID=301880 RepID=A0ABQ5BMB0_9ASTR
MRNGAMSEVHLARFNAVRKFDDHRINCELDGVDVSNMMSRRDFIHFLNKATEDIVHKLPKILEERLEMMKNNNKEQRKRRGGRRGDEENEGEEEDEGGAEEEDDNEKEEEKLEKEDGDQEERQEP